MIVLIDNYDSFSWNLADLIRRHVPDVKVIRNDEETAQEVLSWNPEAIVISPGPGRPSDSGICGELLTLLPQETPVLGICLGHQLICELNGGTIVHAGEPVHGKTSEIIHDGKGIFKGIGSPFSAMRYHSLVLDPATLPSSFEVSAHTPQGTIMGVRHLSKPIQGVQFHPESILTEPGDRIVKNWVEMLNSAPATKEAAKKP